MYINDNIMVEAFCKRKGGKEYRTVRVFPTKGVCVEVGDYQVDTDKKALEKATSALESAVGILKDYHNKK